MGKTPVCLLKKVMETLRFARLGNLPAPEIAAKIVEENRARSVDSCRSHDAPKWPGQYSNVKIANWRCSFYDSLAVTY